MLTVGVVRRVWWGLWYGVVVRPGPGVVVPGVVPVGVAAARARRRRRPALALAHDGRRNQ